LQNIASSSWPLQNFGRGKEIKNVRNEGRKNERNKLRKQKQGKKE
jgi:hypothetical protein